MASGFGREKRVFPTNSVFINTSKVEGVAVKVSNEKQDEGRRRGMRIEDSFDVKHKAESSSSKDEKEREMEIPFPKVSNGIVPSCLSLPR